MWRSVTLLLAALVLAFGLASLATAADTRGKRIVHVVPDLDLTFWQTLSEGVRSVAEARNYDFEALNAKNNGDLQLQRARKAISAGVNGLVLTPTDSSTAPEVLELAVEHEVPLVIADVGTDRGDYLSFVISDDFAGGKRVGEVLGKELAARGWQDAPVGIVAISQARRNGQDRTRGFLEGMAEAGFVGTVAALREMQSYSAEETFAFTQHMLAESQRLRAVFVQTDQPALGALRAIREAGREGDVLVATFDGIPAFIELLKSDAILVSGMQQPYLMGQQAGEALVEHLSGGAPDRRIVVPILIVTPANINDLLPRIRRTVFGEEEVE